MTTRDLSETALNLLGLVKIGEYACSDFIDYLYENDFSYNEVKDFIKIEFKNLYDGYLHIYIDSLYKK